MQIQTTASRLRSRSRRKDAPASSQRCAVSLRGAGGCTDGHVSWQFRHRGLRRRADAARPCGRVRILHIAFSAAPEQSVRVMLNVVRRWPECRHGFPDGGSIHQPHLAAHPGRQGRACMGRRRADVVFRHAGPSISLWTSSPGSAVTSQRKSRSRLMSAASPGGDYWNTNYPQPTYLSSRRYALHVETTAYSRLRLPPRGLPRARSLGCTRSDRAHGSAHLYLTRRVHVRSLRPPAAAAGMGLWWRDHRPEGWCRFLRAIGCHRRGGHEGVRPVVRGLGGPAPHLIRGAPVLGLESQ